VQERAVARCRSGRWRGAGAGGEVWAMDGESNLMDVCVCVAQICRRLVVPLEKIPMTI
jgi:hypothetical protein